MPITLYKLFSKANTSRADGNSASEIWDVGIHALAKRSLENEYAIANEYVALKLAQALNLPAPDGTAIEENGKLYFCSMVFTGSGQRLPPADTQRLATNMQDLACGIVVFDTWICNPDRNELNLTLDETTNSVTLFDHANSLFGAIGTAAFEQYAASMCINRYNHSVALELRSFFGIDLWLEKVNQISVHFLRELTRDVVELGVTTNEAHHLHEFLIARRKQLRTLFSENQYNQDIFPQVKRSLFSIHPEPDDHIEYRI